jgi:hypothetical protein
LGLLPFLAGSPPTFKKKGKVSQALVIMRAMEAAALVDEAVALL